MSAAGRAPSGAGQGGEAGRGGCGGGGGPGVPLALAGGPEQGAVGPHGQGGGDGDDGVFLGGGGVDAGDAVPGELAGQGGRRERLGRVHRVLAPVRPASSSRPAAVPVPGVAGRLAFADLPGDVSQAGPGDVRGAAGDSDVGAAFGVQVEPRGQGPEDPDGQVLRAAMASRGAGGGDRCGICWPGWRWCRGEGAGGWAALGQGMNSRPFGIRKIAGGGPGGTGGPVSGDDGGHAWPLAVLVVRESCSVMTSASRCWRTWRDGAWPGRSLRAWSSWRP